MMQTLPKLIEIHADANGRPVSLWVDGVEFPWALSPDINLSLTRDGISYLELSMLAERVQVVYPD